MNKKEVATTLLAAFTRFCEKESLPTSFTTDILVAAIALHIANDNGIDFVQFPSGDILRMAQEVRQLVTKKLHDHELKSKFPNPSDN